jgi:hypothetical protein
MQYSQYSARWTANKKLVFSLWIYNKIRANERINASKLRTCGQQEKVREAMNVYLNILLFNQLPLTAVLNSSLFVIG